MTNKTLAPIGIALVALFGLTACDDSSSGEVTENDTSNEEVEEQNEELEEQDEEMEEEVEEEEPETSSERPTFGDTYTYDDGLAVTISQPEEFTPGEYSSGGEDSPQHVMFEVTIENGTGEEYDPNMVSITASSGGSEAESVFDSDAGLEGPSMTTLTEDQSTTFPYGFGVEDASDLTVEFTDIDFERDSVLFVTG